MNLKIFTQLLFLLALTFLASCKTRKMSFNPKKITKLEQKGYKVKFDSLNIDFKNFLISSNKINSVTKNRNKKTNQIKSKGRQSKIINGIEMLALLKEKYSVSEIDLLIIDGVIFDSKMEKLLFDLNYSMMHLLYFL